MMTTPTAYSGWGADPVTEETPQPVRVSPDRMTEARSIAAERAREDRLLRDLPVLEAQHERERRRAERQRQREQAMTDARAGMAVVRERQQAVPAAVDAAREAFAAAVRAVAAVQEAERPVVRALLLADDLDFAGELEAAQEQARIQGRDEKSALFNTRPRVADDAERARRLLVALDPAYDLFAGVPKEGRGYPALVYFLREQAGR